MTGVANETECEKVFADSPLRVMRLNGTRISAPLTMSASLFVYLPLHGVLFVETVSRLHGLLFRAHRAQLSSAL